jgi:hypothetical protein
VLLQLPPGASVILRTFDARQVEGPAWTWWRPLAEGRELTGDWSVQFLNGGPELPAAFSTGRLASWTDLGGEQAQRFAGTARYSLKFDVPAEQLKAEAAAWQLDLGEVAQSARVRLNGKELGTWITPPFAMLVSDLKPTDNLLEVEVTNVSANRIRDLDRRGVVWRTFHDINFVNLNYRPFDASEWPLTASGLLGPVTLSRVAPLHRQTKQPSL